MNSDKLVANNGFGRDENTRREYVEWMGESGAHHQRVHYLHGALHLFDLGSNLQKYTWANTGRSLLEQVQEAMEHGRFPLFVAEGASSRKPEKTRHNAYLYHSYKSFSLQMQSREDSLFISGHSLAENDQHILDRITQGKIRQICVGLYSSPENTTNRRIIYAANTIKSDRDDSNPPDVKFFHAASANVWGSTAAAG